jgi:DNA-binding transcriptional regulator YhcF (GntR family)
MYSPNKLLKRQFYPIKSNLQQINNRAEQAIIEMYRVPATPLPTPVLRVFWTFLVSPNTVSTPYRYLQKTGMRIIANAA